MKRLLSILLASLMLFTLVACGDTSKPSNSNAKTEDFSEYVGLWMSEDHETMFYFDETGAGRLERPGYAATLFSSIRAEKNQLIICGLAFDIVQTENGTELNYNNGEYVVTKYSDEPIEPLVRKKEGIASINAQRFHEIMEIVTLTPENWREYLEVVEVTNTYTRRDEFGEVLSTETEIYYVLDTIADRYHVYQNFEGEYYYNAIIELKHKESGESFVLSIGSDRVESTLNLDDFDCTRVQASIIFVDLPEEAIHAPLPEWNYDCGFQVVDWGSCTPYRINTSTKSIGLNGSWEGYTKNIQ